MRQVALKSEKLLCCLKNHIFPFFKNVLVSLVCFPGLFFLFFPEAMRGLDLRFLATIKLYCPIRRIFVLVFNLVYIYLWVNTDEH